MDSKDFYTTGEVSSLLNISRATVSRKFDEGILKGKKNPITGERQISHESLLELMRKYDLPTHDIESSTLKCILVGSSDQEIQHLSAAAFCDVAEVQVVNANSGYEMLIRCSKEPPDLLILDEEMENIDWSEALRTLSQHYEHLKMKIIYLKASSGRPKKFDIDADIDFSKDTLDDKQLYEAVFSMFKREKQYADSSDAFEHKRRWQRTPLEIPAELVLEVAQNPHYRDSGSMKIENISLGGAYLSDISLGNNQIPVGSIRLKIIVNQPPLENWNADCQLVRFQTDEKLNAGVEFIGMSDENRDRLTGIVGRC